MEYDVVAKYVRVEVDQCNGDFYLVFKIVDESFKKRFRDDPNQDLCLFIKEGK